MDTTPNSWAALLRDAAKTIQSSPVERVEALREQYRALQADLPRGALKEHARAADKLESQFRRVAIKSLGDEACAVLAEFGLRMRVEGVAQRRTRNQSSTKPVPAPTTQGNAASAETEVAKTEGTDGLHPTEAKEDTTQEARGVFGMRRAN